MDISTQGSAPIGGATPAGTKKSFLTVGIIVVIIAVAAIVIMNTLGSTPTSPTPAALDLPVPKTPVEIQNRITEATAASDTGLCDTLPAGQQEICTNEIIIAKARQTGDETVCDKITQVVVRDGCKDMIVYTSAINDRNPAACKGIQDSVLQKECVTRASVK